MLWLLAFVACAVSLVSFFSGFGLGTILTPVFALFFPLEIAIALTAVVHLLNNLFKLLLTAGKIDRAVFLRFGIPSLIGALAGSFLLERLGQLHTLYIYEMGGRSFEITALKVIIAMLMIIFTLVEFIPGWKTLEADRSKLVAGGVLSGFFGGLSGHQGALRSIFLVRSGMSKESFIATGIVIGCIVDITRIPVYFSRIAGTVNADGWYVIVVTTLSGFAGAFVGSRLLKKITLDLVQKMVAVMIVLLACALGSGVI
ncbi:MAG TPA: sulfite exporter TauE/SafE family protein [Bacteroidia bacterium]|jgi:uncharacterized membrane protein YfcA